MDEGDNSMLMSIVTREYLTKKTKKLPVPREFNIPPEQGMNELETLFELLKLRETLCYMKLSRILYNLTKANMSIYEAWNQHLADEI